MKDSDHVWTKDEDQRLTEGWLAGRSCVTLAKEFGVTKNAVVGHKSRLGLPNRISPIRGSSSNFKGQGGKRKVRAGLETLPPIAAPVFVAPPPPLPLPPVVQIRSYPPREVPIRTPSACCWPIGHPGTKAFRFCDDVALPGKPYCNQHYAIAYVRRSAAAA